MGGKLNISAASGFGPGAYTLFSPGVFLGGSLPVIVTQPARYICSVIVDGAGRVRLLVGERIPAFENVMATGSNLIFSATSGPGFSNRTVYVLTSTNVTFPLSNWTWLATNQFDGNGNFTFTNAPGSNVSQQYYLLQLP
jgi:hypothetical protein